MARMTKCKHCNGEIASNAKTCPHCGAKIKKTPVWAVILVVILIIAIMPKGNSKKTTNSDKSTAPSSTAKIEKIQEVKETEAPAATIEEQTIFEGNNVIIKVVGMEKSGANWNVNIYIENNSALNLGFNAHSYAVNGIMTGEGIYSMDVDVAAGKKANTALTIKNSFLKEYGITADNIRCIDVLFWAYDNDKSFKEFDTGQIEIKTNKYDGTHDNIVSEKIFEQQNITVSYLDAEKNKYSFVISNNTGSYFNYDFKDISINDYTVSDTDFDLYDEVLLDGCQTVCVVKVKNDFMETNKIDTVNTIDWNMSIRTLGSYFNEYSIGLIKYEVK